MNSLINHPFYTVYGILYTTSILVVNPHCSATIPILFLRDAHLVMTIQKNGANGDVLLGQANHVQLKGLKSDSFFFVPPETNPV